MKSKTKALLLVATALVTSGLNCPMASAQSSSSSHSDVFQQPTAQQSLLFQSEIQQRQQAFRQPTNDMVNMQEAPQRAVLTGGGCGTIGAPVAIAIVTPVSTSLKAENVDSITSTFLMLQGVADQMEQFQGKVKESVVTLIQSLQKSDSSNDATHRKLKPVVPNGYKLSGPNPAVSPAVP